MIREQKLICSYSFAVIFLFVLAHSGWGQAKSGQVTTLRLVFYNVENFFDTKDDPSTNDNDFTPEGKLHWTRTRYIAKRNAIFRVVANAGEWEPPALVALCEIENRYVLDDLLKNTPLTKYPYKIVHKDSPDARGIDVALIYRSDLLKSTSQQFIRVRFKDNRKRTRDILYTTFLTLNKDTLHLFVNHWPSRSGGQKQSEPARVLAASLLRHKVDSVFSRNPLANIIITGDLNDGPNDRSVRQALKALPDTAHMKSSTLFNLTAYKTNEKTGTLKYQGRWSVFDQIIVSGAMLRPKNRLYTDLEKCSIFRTDYLLESDKRYSGVKPFRTYIGFTYHKGYSDHLPVLLDIMCN